MATGLYANNFDDGGLNLITNSGGSPSSVSSPAPPFANYAIQLDAGEYIGLQSNNLEVLLPSASVTSPIKVTFKVRFTDVTPGASIDFFRQGANNDTDAGANIALRLRTDGDVEIRSADNTTVDATISAPFTADTWHEISVWVQISATGNAEVVFDGNSTTTTSKDYLSTSGSTSRCSWQNNTSSAMTMYVTEVTYWHSVTNNSDISDIFDVYGWRPGGTPTGTGTVLDSGSWANTGEDPGSDSNSATYNAGANDGFAEFDSTGGGPASDAGTPTTTYVMGTYYQRAKQGTGAGTTLEWNYGDSDNTTGDITSLDMSGNLAGAINDFLITTTDTGIMPTSSQDAASGMVQNGARDYIIYEQRFMLAVEKAGEAHTATAAPLLAEFALVAAGEQPHEGTAAPALGAFTLVSAGVMQPAGTAVPALSDMALVAAGEQPHGGTGVPVLEILSLTAVGAHPLQASGAPTLEALVLVASGLQTLPGTAAPSLAELSLVSSGAMQPAGTGAQTLEVLSLTAAGEQPYEGVAAAVLEALSLTAVGVIQPQATGAPLLEAFALTAAGVMQPAGTAVPALSDMALVAASEQPHGGTGVPTLEALLLEASGLHDASAGTAAPVLNIFVLSSAGEVETIVTVVPFEGLRRHVGRLMH